MTTPRTLNAVQEPTKCIEGLHMMYIDDAMLIDGAFRPDNLVQKLHLDIKTGRSVHQTS